MQSLRIRFLTSCLVGLLVGFAMSEGGTADELFDVTINGSVEFNQISGGVLGGVSAGESASLSFQLDSANFVNGAFPTRGYVIDLSSFLLEFSGGASMGLQDPFPAGETPYFVIRNDDPGVDGFFVATSTDFPTGVPLNQTGIFGQFLNNFQVTYDGATLGSLDLADAVGSYDFTGLTVFNWTIDDGPFNATGLVFSDLTISRAIPEPGGTCVILGLFGFLAVRRRK